MMQNDTKLHSFFTPFDSSWQNHERPKKFNFPFYYQAHPLAVHASEQLQKKLKENPWQHNFGLDPQLKGMVIGKMFGVLVVENQEGVLGYLAAFSGKLAESNHHQGFVPTVFDMLNPQDYYKKEEEKLNELNHTIAQLEKDTAFKRLKEYNETQIIKLQDELQKAKNDFKVAQKIRQQLRKEKSELLGSEDILSLQEEHKKTSLFQQHQIKILQQAIGEKIAALQLPIQKHQDQIKELKQKRKDKSKALQHWLFEQYNFLNAEGNEKSLNDIFTPPLFPPAGAGECAAPKLLHFAYANELKPICMAEFWWGASPKSAVRKHQQFYPACRSKCEPILGHMLKGLTVDDNPMLLSPASDIDLAIIYEDEDLLVVNKPAEFLSVPGKNVKDSVQFRMEQKFPEAKDHLIVHRLDMSTSGIMVLTKNKKAHHFLQQQFINKTAQKKYIALLDGVIKEAGGEIKLPLRVDLDRRPMQLVCYEHGKHAHTTWERVVIKEGKTRVHFYPHTGRTHQLRVHAAHNLGLNTPIIGDDIYGTPANRLHLHAAELKIIHPSTKKELILSAPAPF